MTIAITKATEADKPVLRNLLNLYLYDMSEFIDLAMQADGTFSYPYLDNYFTKDSRDAYLLYKNSQPIGFALIQYQESLLEHKKGQFITAVSEFFILKSERHQGAGEQAFKDIISQYANQCELSIIAANQPAISFWHKVLERHTGSKPFPERTIRDGEPRLVFTFPANPKPAEPAKEINGPAGPEPTRFGDWEHNGRCIDF